MGVVFQAEDPHLRRRVALKVIAPRLAGDPSARQRFLREARAAAAIEHDHVITIHHIDEDGGVPYVAMPLLKGESLAARFHRLDMLPLPEVLRIGAEVARGLEATHGHGLIHRDIKPGNIWLEEPGGKVKILDFGLAYSAADDSHLTHSGAAMGTPTYMAPEQSGGTIIDHRVDLFSLGCVLYRAATGKMPFRAPDETPLPPALAVTEAVPPHTLRPQLPRELSELILRMLARSRHDRPDSAREVAETLETMRRALPPSVENANHGCSQSGLWHGGNRRKGLVALLVTAILAAAGMAKYFATDQGTLKVQTLDPGVKVMVEQNGHLVTSVAPRTFQEVTLWAGEYTVRLEEERKDIEVSPARITIRRGTKSVVSVTPAGPVAEWAATVAALPAEKQTGAVSDRLRELNPAFDGNVTPTINDGVVTGLFLITDKVTDLQPIRALRGLTTLEARGSSPGKGRLADLSPLTGLALTTLRCGNNPITDVAPLRGMQLKTLTFGNSEVSSLEPLRGMPLTDLDFWANRVTDLAPLRGMALERLNCGNNPITDLEPLKGMALKALYCDFQSELHADVLRSFKTLETIRGVPAAEFWKQVGEH